MYVMSVLRLLDTQDNRSNNYKSNEPGNWFPGFVIILEGLQNGIKSVYN